MIFPEQIRELSIDKRILGKIVVRTVDKCIIQILPCNINFVKVSFLAKIIVDAEM